jgi:hypothetical protein
MGKRDAWFFRVKAAHRDLIKACGGIERSAEVCGMSPATVGRWNNPEVDELINLRAKARLEADCEYPWVTRVELQALGYEIHQVGVVEAGRAADVHGSTSRVVAEASDVMRSYSEALAGGKITPADIAALQKELGELAHAVEEARMAGAALLAVAKGLRHE